MARGVQLDQLVSDLRAEIGHSSKVSVGTDFDDMLKVTLRRVQEELYDDYDWPHLEVFKYKDLSDGQRYYDPPSGLNVDRITNINCWYNGEPHPMRRGISFAEYAAYSSDDDERSDPALAWDLRYNSGSTQIEVWPIPDSDSNKLLIHGYQNLSSLVSGSDTCDLDDITIVLFAAAEILARQKSDDAQAKQAKAQRRYATVKARLAGGSEPFVMGGGGNRRAPYRGRTIIRISG